MHTDKLSLHYSTWVDHADSLYLAAYENFKNFTAHFTNPDSKTWTLQSGLFRASCLLYAVSLEVIIKARVLFEKRKEIASGQISEFQEIAKQWPGNGHKVIEIIDFYNYNLLPEERELVIELEPFMI